MRNAVTRALVGASLVCAAACTVVVPSAMASLPSMGLRDVSHEVIVRFDPGTSTSVRADALGAVDPTTSRSLVGLSRTRVVTLAAGASRAQAIAELQADPAVTWVQPNRIRHVMVAPSDPLFGDLWAFSTSSVGIGAQSAWDHFTGSADVGVGVVDSGIDPQHPDLVANLRAGESRNFAESASGGAVDPADWSDGSHHGTHVAGIIGAVGNNGIGVTGVNWRSGLVAARAMMPDGSGSDDAIIGAMAWAAEHGRVVNMSLGGSGSSPGEEAVVVAHPDTLFVVAAGNDTSDNDVAPISPCVIPADNLLCVASTDQTGALSDFSNWGATTVDLAAPGSDILSTVPTFTEYLPDPGFTSLTGTWTQDRTPPGGGPWWVRSELDDGTPFADLADTTGGSHTWTLDSGATGTVSGGNCILNFDIASVPRQSAPPITITISLWDGAGWVTLYDAVQTSTGGRFVPYAFDMSSFVGRSGLRTRVTVQGNATFGVSPANYRVGVIESLRCVTPPVGPGEYDVLSGTSMATPVVAGAAALLLAKNPTLTVAQLRHALLSTVTRDDRLAGRLVSGGRLDLAAALAAVPPAPVPAGESPAVPGPAGTPVGSTSVSAGAVLATSRDARHVSVPVRCAGEPGMRCGFDLAIQQRVRVNGRMRWSTWGVLRGVDVPAGWRGRRNVRLGARARDVLARHPRARVSLAVVGLAPDLRTPTGTTRTPITLRRP